ncbi:Serine/threonine-protein kinase ULK2 [Sesbania bispinosa]|nr:Serine/threonine-protein kinase ULK2 [Sesbania bispinosa]
MEVVKRPNASQFGPLERDSHNGCIHPWLVKSVGDNSGSGPLTFGPCVVSEHVDDKIVAKVVRGRDVGLSQGLILTI